MISLGGAPFKGPEDRPKRGSALSKMGPHNEKPAGEWNTYEIVASGNTIKNSVNGKLMNQALECGVTSGHIAIQSEGGEIEVRSIYVEPIGAP